MEPEVPEDKRQDPCRPPASQESSEEVPEWDGIASQVDALRAARQEREDLIARVQYLEQNLQQERSEESAYSSEEEDCPTPRAGDRGRSPVSKGPPSPSTPKSKPLFGHGRCPGIFTPPPPQSDLPAASTSSPSPHSFSTMTVTTPGHQRTEVSPSSSPRLPSPPPFTEVQIGPKSPTIEGPAKNMEELSRQDDNAARRIRPGTKAADMASGPPLVPLADLESPFQLQEHLKALYYVHIKGGNNTITPISRKTALVLATPPTGVERPLWLYELCRFLVMKANDLIVAFFLDHPPCSKETCPEMRASEWQYLCAVHDPPKSCCAIDYCCHTLDWAANILTSTKYFPSRLSLGGEMGGGSGSSQQSMKHLTNIFRRVYRIFAHAWFQHRGMFWQVEGSQGLYIFFKTVCDLYQLIPEDNYTIPNEAEGDEETAATPVDRSRQEIPAVNVMRKIEKTPASNANAEDLDGDATATVSVGATTRRHKHTPSTGVQVMPIAESLEDEDEAPASNLGSKVVFENVEAPKGRSGSAQDENISQELGKLRIDDLGNPTGEVSAADLQTPQPQAEEGDPMDESSSSVPIALSLGPTTKEIPISDEPAAATSHKVSEPTPAEELATPETETEAETSPEKAPEKKADDEKVIGAFVETTVEPVVESKSSPKTGGEKKGSPEKGVEKTGDEKEETKA